MDSEACASAHDQSHLDESEGQWNMDSEIPRPQSQRLPVGHRFRGDTHSEIESQAKESQGTPGNI